MAAELHTPNVYGLDPPRAEAVGELLTTRQVAEMLQLHVNTVKRLGDRGDLPFFRVSSRGDRRFRLADVTAFLERGATASGSGLTAAHGSGPTPLVMSAAMLTTLPGQPVIADAESSWLRWRRGDRVCVVCTAPPSASVPCPPPWLPPIGLASSADPWLVPVCPGHADIALWPGPTLLALCDEHRAVNDRHPGQLDLWRPPTEAEPVAVRLAMPALRNASR